MRQAFLLIATVILLAASGFAHTIPGQDSATAPAADSKSSLPVDRHEGMAVSADAYSDFARAKSKFGKSNPLQVGILPVEVFLHNESGQAMRIQLETIQLVVHFQDGSQQELDWLDIKEVASTIAHPNGPPAPKTRRFPVGIGSISDKKTDKVVDELQPFALDADVVPPMATVHGFLFFNLGDDVSLARTATIYVPDVTNLPTSKPLMFFEVKLGKNE